MCKREQNTLYTLPKDDERRMKWLTFLNRKKGTLPKTVYICGEHFVTGQKSNDKNHPDYVPSIAKRKPNIATSAPLISTSLKRSMRYRKILSTRRVNQQRKIISTPAEAANIIKPTGSSSEYVELEEETICEQSTSNITDAHNIQNLQEIINQQKFKLKQSKTEISSLKRTLQSSIRNNRLTKIKIDKQTLLNRKLNEQLLNVNKILHDHLFLSLDNTVKVKFYTGLPSMEIFEQVFNLVEGHIDRNGTKLTKKQEFIIVMMRLGLGLLD